MWVFIICMSQLHESCWVKDMPTTLNLGIYIYIVYVYKYGWRVVGNL